MKFIKKMFKSEDEKLRDKIKELGELDKAINLYDKFSNFDRELINNIFKEEKFWDGEFIGNKGWYLPKYHDKMDNIWEELKNGPIDLKIIAKDWGLNEKRVYIAIEREAKDRKTNIIRKKMLVFSEGYFLYLWTNIVSTLDTEVETTYDQAINNLKINSEYKKYFTEFITKYLRSDKSSYCIGKDNVIRHKEIIPELIEELIPKKWAEGITELRYEDIADEYGLSLEETRKIIQKLADANKLKNTTNYPMDEILKSRI